MSCLIINPYTDLLLPTTFDINHAGVYVSLSSDALTASVSTDTFPNIVLGTTKRDAGVFYFTMKRTGPYQTHIGLVPSRSLAGGYTAYLGVYDGIAWASNGRFWTNGSWVSASLFAENDLIGVLCDWPNALAKWYINGSYSGYSATLSGDMYPAASLIGTTNPMTVVANFGASAFGHAIPGSGRSWDNSQ